MANVGDNSVTELDGSTGSLVRVLSGPTYPFPTPDAIATNSTHVWVANSGGTVTEFTVPTATTVPTTMPRTPPIGTQLAELKGSDTVAGDGFGSSVAISGTTAVVGAPGSQKGAGRAYVFTKTTAGWKQVVELPRLRTVPLAEIIAAVGCCKASASDYRRGKRTPHVSTWSALGELVAFRTQRRRSADMAL